MSAEPWHGTLQGYNRHRCRCKACAKVSRDYHHARRAIRRARAKRQREALKEGPKPPPVTPGTAPVFRCSYCNYWRTRVNGEPEPDCPYCQRPMFAAIRRAPEPSPAWGTVFEEL